MADEPLSALSETFQYGYSTSDVMLILDVLDTSMWTTGTDKGITVATFLAQYLHAGSNITLTPGCQRSHPRLDGLGHHVSTHGRPDR